MYYPDLTRYTYTPGYGDTLLNVGWLERGQPFATGEVSEAFVEALFALCLTQRIQLYRGHHNCDLKGCPTATRSEVSRNGQTLGMGNGEIQSDGEDGVSYRAPTLIYHYVTEHHYLPPPAFIAAVLRTPIWEGQRHK